MDELIEMKTLVHVITARQPEVIRQQDEELTRLRRDGWHICNMSSGAAFNHAVGVIEVTRVTTLERTIKPAPAQMSLPAECEERDFVEVLIDLEDRREPTPDQTPLPQPAQARRRVVSGTVHHQPAQARKPVNEVGFAEAFASGRYTAEELREIGNRQAMAAGLRVYHERQRYGTRQWEGLLMRLPGGTI